MVAMHLRATRTTKIIINPEETEANARVSMAFVGTHNCQNPYKPISNRRKYYGFTAFRAPRCTKTLIKPKENEGNAKVFMAFVDSQDCKNI